MPSWLQWINNRVKNLDMLGSIWFANLDCLVNNVQYLYDDSDEHQQSDITDKSCKSNESKQCNKSASHNCATSTCGICNGTRPNCYCKFPTNGKHGHNARNKNGIKWGDICTKPRYKYYDDVGYRESTRSTQG